MPILFWLDTAGLVVCAIGATVLALIVLASGARRTLNRVFILFALAEAAWAMASVLLRLALLVKMGNPLLLLGLAALTFVLMGPFLLMFSVRYVDRSTRRADLAAGLGLVAAIPLSVPLFRHQLILNPRLDLTSGATLTDLSTWGLVASLLPVLYLVWSLVLFWQARHRKLALSVLALLIGFVTGRVVGAPPLIAPVMNILSVSVLSYSIVRHQVFSPLRELTEQLEQGVQERTQELAQASAQLSVIHALGQRLVLSRDAAEIARLVVEAAQQVLHVAVCGLWAVDEERETLVRLAHTAGPEAQDILPIPVDSEQSVVASVFRSGETLYLPDVGQDPRYLSGGIDSRSELCVPLRVGGLIMGVLNAESMNLDGFSQSDIRLMEALSSSAAIAIRNARLYLVTRERARRLAVVNHIANAIGAAVHLDDLMEIVHQEIASAFHPDAFFIALYEEEIGEVDLCFLVDEGVRHPPERHSLGVGLTSVVISGRGPLLIRDLERERDRLPPQVVVGTGKSAVSWLGVPMVVDEQLIGVISVQAYRPRAWDEEDELLLSTIADQVAMALEKARLFDERERRVTELAIVNEIGRSVSSTMEMGDLLDTVYQQASRLFDTTNFQIAVYEEQSREWRVAFYTEDGEKGPAGRRYPIETGLTGYVISNRTPLLLGSGKQILACEEVQGIESLGPLASSWLGVPLITADKVVGMMGIQSYEQENLYTEQDLALFSTIAAQVAPVLDNLRLLEEARRRAEELEIVSEVGQAITSVLDLDTVFRHIVDATKGHFGHYFVGIALVEEDQLVFRSGSTVGDSDFRLERGQLGVALSYESSLVAEAARSERPLLVGDVLGDPRYLRVEELPATRSELCIPIKVAGRVIGMLDVQSDRPFAYGEADIALLQIVANYAGVAIDNARLFEEAYARAEELAVLNELGRALTARLSVEQVLDEAYRGMSRLMDATNFYVALYDADRDQVTFAFDATEGNILRFFSTRQAGEGLTEYVIRSRAPLLISDNLPERLEELGIEAVGRMSLSWLGVPLVTGGQVLGVMAVQSYTTPRAYDEHDRDMLTAIASQVAIAIQNAQSYGRAQDEIAERKRAEERVRRRAAQAALIYEVGQRVSSRLELEALLSEIVTAVHDAFDYYGVLLLLLEEGSQYLTLQAIAGGYAGLHLNGLRIAIGEGMTGHAAATGETQISGDVSQDPHYVRKAGEKTRSELAVPIKRGDKIIGVLDLQSDELDAFDMNDVMLMEILADQLAAAIENARLYEETQQRLREQRMLFDASQRLAGAPLRAGEVAEVGVQQLADVMGSTACSFSLLAPNGETLQTLADFWVEDGVEHLEKRGEVYNLSAYPATARVMHTLEPLVVQASDPNADPAELAYMRENNESATLAVFPLAVKGKAVGVMELETWEERHYTPEQISMAMTLANQVAAALENARLYEAVQQELSERTRAEEALAAERDLLHALMDNSPDAIYFKDADSRFTRINQAQARTLGIDPDDAVGKTDHDFFTPEHAHDAYADEHRIIKSGQPLIDKIERILRADGQFRWVSTTKVPVLGKDGRVTGTVGITRDITERRRVDEALRESEARFRQMAENIDQAFWLIGPSEDDRVYISPAYEKIWGRSCRSWHEKPESWLDAVHPEDRERVAAKLHETSQTDYEMEYRIVRPDGAVRWVRNRAFPIFDERGKLRRTAGFSEDITERKWAEQALKESYEVVGTVLDSVDADVYVSSFDSYEILFMNKHMQDSLGGDFTGRVCWEVFRGASGPCGHCTNDQLLDADGNPTGVCVWEEENPLTGNWYINYDRAIRWVDGRFVRLQVAMDITKVKQAEETLRRQKEYLDALHATTLGLISRLQLSDLLEVIATRAASLARAPSGFVYLYDPSQNELVMQVGLGNVKEAVGLRLKPEEGMVGRVWQTGQTLVMDHYDSWEGRVADPRFDGIHSVMGIPLKSGDQVVGVIGLGYHDDAKSFEGDEIDVLSRFAELASIALYNAQLYTQLEQELAERERAEKALRDSEERLQQYAAELEQANEEVKRFAYIVSHDLRAPLVNMKGFTTELRLALDEIQAVMDAAVPHLDEGQRQTIQYALHEDAPEALMFIDSSVEHMDRFISALLKLSRLGRRELKLEQVDMNGVVASILPTLAHQIAAHEGEVRVGELPEVVADRTSMEQVMANILGNAVKYLTSERPAEIEVSGERLEKETRFRITDNGRGIAEEDMDKLFTPFRRAGRQDVPGEGMGLAYVQTLVRRHGGRIWCESEYGLGTTFSFTISNELESNEGVGYG
jgi:PAS domain S-box-containing protein